METGKETTNKPKRFEQFVCFDTLHFLPEQGYSYETIKFIFHGAFKTSNMEAENFKTPFILASQEYLIASESLAHFLSDWLGQELTQEDIADLTYDDIRGSIISSNKKTAVNAYINKRRRGRTCYIELIRPFTKTTSILRPIKGLPVPKHLTNRVLFTPDEILGASKLLSKIKKKQED